MKLFAFLKHSFLLYELIGGEQQIRERDRDLKAYAHQSGKFH